MDKLLYKDGYYLDGRIETIAIFPRNNSMFYYCTEGNVNPSYDIHAEEWYEKIASKEGRKYWWECTKTVWCTHSPTQPAPIA